MNEMQQRGDNDVAESYEFDITKLFVSVELKMIDIYVESKECRFLKNCL